MSSLLNKEDIVLSAIEELYVLHCMDHVYTEPGEVLMVLVKVCPEALDYSPNDLLFAISTVFEG